MSHPFLEIKKGENAYIRYFSDSNHDDEYCWHRDKEERKVKVISCGKDWKFQFDNNFPFILKEGMRIDIKKKEWHKLHKGKNRLILEIVKG